MKLKLMTLALLTTLSIPAQAKWSVDMEPSAFSDKQEGYITSDDDDDDNSIVFDCEDNKLTASFVMLLPEDDYEDMDSGISIPMRLKTGNEAFDFGPTEFARRNGHYVGIESKKASDAARALYMVRNANGPITMGIKVSGTPPVSLTVPATGAKSAADRIARECDIDLTHKTW